MRNRHLFQIRILVTLLLMLSVILGVGSGVQVANATNTRLVSTAQIHPSRQELVAAAWPAGVWAGWWATVQDSLHLPAAPLPPTPNTVLYGGVRQAGLGASISIVGDVNGDGYDDVVVGAPYWGAFTGPHVGRAYLFLGSASGLATTPAWMVEGGGPQSACGNYYCNMGSGVGAAGDVNGDGFDDVIVASGRWSNGQVDEGRVFVYYGSTSGLGSAPNWTAESNRVRAYFGGLGSAGDVNGDGYDDIIVGALRFANPISNEGKVFVYLGSASGLSCGAGCPVDATAAAAWTFESDQANAELGWAAGTAGSVGDVNGDGYDDVVVGAHFYDEGGRTDAGKAWLFLGSASGLGNTPAWSAVGDQNGAEFAYASGTAGDVNGDGYDDVLVGAYRYDNGQTDEGRAYLYLGSATGLAATPAWTAESDQANALFGMALAKAGDLNGDGYGDVVVGAVGYDNGQTDEGRAWVYLGSAAGLSPAAAWMAEGDQGAASFGYAVAARAGDVNDDGLDDLIVGAHQWDQTYSDGGAVFVYHGIQANRPPVAEASGPYTVSEGASVTFDGTGSHDPDPGDTFTYAWDLDGDGVYGETGANATRGDETGATPTFSAAGLDGPGSVTVSLRVTDQDGLSGSDAATVDVTNVLPAVDPPTMTPEPSAEGSEATASVMFSDPGSLDTFTCTVDYGDGSGAQPGAVSDHTCAGLAHTYTDDGTYSVVVVVTDDDGGAGSHSTDHQVGNVPPEITGLSLDSATISEDGVATLSGQFSDPGASDTHEVAIDWGDGSTGSAALDAGARAFSVSHRYLDDNPTGTPSDAYAIGVTVSDDDNGSDSGTTAVTVDNLSPAVDAGPDQVTYEDVVVSLAPATFADVGTQDTHTATIDWGDGAVDMVMVAEAGGSGTVSGTHVYPDPGTYIVTIAVADDDGGLGADTLTVKAAHGFLRFCGFANDAYEGVLVQEGARIVCSLGSNGRVDVQKSTAITGDLVSVHGRVDLGERAAATGDIAAGGDVQLAKRSTVGRSVTSGAAVTLKQGARVDGNVMAAGQVRLETGATVGGTVSQWASVPAIPPVAAVQLALSAGGPDITVHQGPRMLAPGSYGKLTVKQRATLILVSGAYTFDQVTFEKDAVVALQLSGGTLLVDVVRNLEMQEAARMTVTGGSAASILFRVQGSHVGLGKSGSFLGTYLAPNAVIDMNEGATLQGALYGQKVHVKKLASVTGQPALDPFVSSFLP